MTFLPLNHFFDFSIGKILLQQFLLMINTFSIVAYDPNSKEWGVAVQSKYFAVSTIVPWAKANVGAMATQSSGNPVHWEKARPLLENGNNATQVLEQILQEDSEKEYRQIGLIDSYGNSIAFTGNKCAPLANHLTGRHYTVQGNFLLPNTVESMEKEFNLLFAKNSSLCDCLIGALKAGEAIGGDSRGKQAAGVLVVKSNCGYNNSNDRYIDLRVDDHVNPIEKLANLVEMHKIMYSLNTEGHLISIDECEMEVINLLKKYPKIYNSEKNLEWNIKLFLNIFNLPNTIDLEDGRIDLRIIKAFNDRLVI
jgi:uncharacterized Ntn-hydrolase superfamily protein